MPVAANIVPVLSTFIAHTGTIDGPLSYYRNTATSCRGRAHLCLGVEAVDEDRSFEEVVVRNRVYNEPAQRCTKKTTTKKQQHNTKQKQGRKQKRSRTEYVVSYLRKKNAPAVTLEGVVETRI